MERIEDCVSFLLGKAFQKVSRQAREALAAHGVTPVQYATLNVLWQGDGLSCSDLCARLVLDSATMTGIVDRLEAAGHVARRPDPEGDRRVNRIYLTAAGHDLRAPLDAIMAGVNRDVDALLGDASANFRAALARLADVAEPSPN
jgi:DNA-binding MarR family transcriptional regulator